MVFALEEDCDAEEDLKPEGIVPKLRQVDVLTYQGQSVAEAIRSIGVSEVTYYRWRREFGWQKSDQVKRLQHRRRVHPRVPGPFGSPAGSYRSMPSMCSRTCLS